MATIIISERQLPLYYKYCARRLLSENATPQTPTIRIEVNADEINYFNAIQNAASQNEKNQKINELRKYYVDFFRNMPCKSVVNKSSGVNVDIVKSGIEHSMYRSRSYRLWPVIRYLPTLIESGSYTKEVSQHINDSNTARGQDVHIFNCSCEFVSPNTQSHRMRIAAITFKNNSKIHFRNVAKENNDILNNSNLNPKCIHTVLKYIEFG